MPTTYTNKGRLSRAQMAAIVVPPPQSKPLRDADVAWIFLLAFALGMVAGYWLHSLPVG